MKLTPQDLSLFLNQEVQTPDGKGILISVGVSVDSNETYAEVEFGLEKGYWIKLAEVKPICRRMEDATKVESNQWFKRTYGILNDDIKKWEDLKWLTSKGICPFEEWFDQGLVIEKVKEKQKV